MFPTQASAFIITYPANNAVDREGNETKKAVAWEKAFIQLAKVCIWPINFSLYFFLNEFMQFYSDPNYCDKLRSSAVLCQ